MNEKYSGLKKQMLLNWGYNIAAGGSGGNTRAGYTPEEYDRWLENKAKALRGKPSKCKGQKRETHSEWLKDAHSKGIYNYNHLKNPKTEEHKRNISKGSIGKKYKRVECSYCKRIVANNSHRWHFDNCKYRRD